MRVFRDAGVDVTIATPGGVRPTVDEASLSAEGAGGEERAAALRGELDALADQLASPAALEEVSADDYDGVFVPGGHGPMEDLASSDELGRLLLRCSTMTRSWRQSATDRPPCCRRSGRTGPGRSPAAG